jgi:hypothetical protein
MERLSEVEDEDMRSFLESVLRHERNILDDPRGEYTEEYKSLVDDHSNVDASDTNE